MLPVTATSEIKASSKQGKLMMERKHTDEGLSLMMDLPQLPIIAMISTEAVWFKSQGPCGACRLRKPYHPVIQHRKRTVGE